MIETDEWKHQPIGIAEMQTVPKAKLMLTLDRAHKAEERLEEITRTMNAVIKDKCDLDVFHYKVTEAWGLLRFRYFPHLISNDERIAAIREHLKAPDVGSNPWLTVLHDLVNLGAAQSPAEKGGSVLGTSTSEVPG